MCSGDDRYQVPRIHFNVLAIKVNNKEQKKEYFQLSSPYDNQPTFFGGGRGRGEGGAVGGKKTKFYLQKIIRILRYLIVFLSQWERTKFNDQ